MLRRESHNTRLECWHFGSKLKNWNEEGESGNRRNDGGSIPGGHLMYERCPERKKRLTLPFFLDNNWLVETWGFFFLRIPCLERKRQRSARPPNHSLESAASSYLIWSKRYLDFHVPLISSALVCFSSCPFSAFLSPHNFCWRSAQSIPRFLFFSSSSFKWSSTDSFLVSVNVKSIHRRGSDGLEARKTSDRLLEKVKLK